tara:strand:- start:8364 stop:8753 length:390 start_codon:yes stop_codon:yes gene_type:complete
MRTIDQIFSEAMSDKVSVTMSMPKGVCAIRIGFKIQKFSDRVEILNMSKGGAYYKECDEEEYKLFTDNGWKKGCVLGAISNCLYKLNLIEEKIKEEVNTRKNDKHIKKLKGARVVTLLKYANHKLKLNQ